MPSFSYAALSRGVLKRGYVEAKSDVHARELLSSLGLERIEVRREDPNVSPLPSFRFRAKRRSGGEVMGIVEALTPDEARARLSDEYDLEVQAIAPFGEGLQSASPGARSNLSPHRGFTSSTPLTSTCLPAGRPRGEASTPEVRSRGGVHPTHRTINPYVGMSEDIDQSGRGALPRRYLSLPFLRFTAGWLLAFYGSSLAVGYYQKERVIAAPLPRFTSLLSSPFVFLLVVSLGLFLLFSSVRTGSRMQRVFVAALGVLMVVFAGRAF